MFESHRSRGWDSNPVVIEILEPLPPARPAGHQVGARKRVAVGGGPSTPRPRRKLGSHRSLAAACRCILSQSAVPGGGAFKAHLVLRHCPAQWSR